MGKHIQQMANTQIGGHGQARIPYPNGELIPRRVSRGITILARADGNLDDGVADLSGRLSLREHILRWARQGDIQQSRNIRWREPSAGALRQG